MLIIRNHVWKVIIDMSYTYIIGLSELLVSWPQQWLARGISEIRYINFIIISLTQSLRKNENVFLLYLMGEICINRLHPDCSRFSCVWSDLRNMFKQRINISPKSLSHWPFSWSTSLTISQHCVLAELCLLSIRWLPIEFESFSWWTRP